MLGTPTKPFEISELRQFLHGSKSLEDLQIVKDYILGYFGHCIDPIGIVMWCPENRIFRLLTVSDAKNLIRKDSVDILIPGTKKPLTFDIQMWFFHEHDTIYNMGCDPAKPVIYMENGRKYINQFAGYLHQNVQKFT